MIIIKISLLRYRNNNPYYFSGTKSQVVQAVMCIDFSMELFIMAIGTYGISSSEYVITFSSLPYVF